MFDIGFLELLFIGVVALLVLGPERLPQAARTTGLWVGRIKRTVSGMQREINAQLEAEELRQKLDEQQKKLDEGINRVKRDVERSVEAPGDQGERRDDTERREPSRATPERRLDDALGGARRQADDSDADAHEDASSR